MDFGKYNSRKFADTGAFMQFDDPFTGEPIFEDDDPNKPCGVTVRGVASPSVQKELREAARKAKGKKQEDGFSMDDAHNRMVDAALPYIIGFERVEIDGAAAGKEDARAVMDLTFPFMETVKDEDGTPVLDDQGRPTIEMINKPFALQVAEFASDPANFKGGGATS